MNQGIHYNELHMHIPHLNNPFPRQPKVYGLRMNGGPESKPRNKWLLGGGALALLIVAAFGIWFFAFRHPTPASLAQKNQAAKTTNVTAQTANNSSIRLIATGDWIAHDSVNTAAKQANGTYNYLPLVSDFEPIFKSADIRFCNDPILNGGESLGISGYPKFNSPTEFVTDMGKLGCNLVNTASNHSFDFTQDAITASVNAWAAVPNTLAVAGENRTQAEHDAVHVFTIKGVKIGFLAYTTYSNLDAPA